MTTRRITVFVKAGSREEKVDDLGEGSYLIRVKAPRKKGKANSAVINLLRKHFGCRAVIIRGHTSTMKIVELEE